VLASGFCLKPLLTIDLLGHCTVRLLQLALQTLPAAALPPTYAYADVLSLPGSNTSQIELSSHSNFSAVQTLVLDTDY
jgi:hypothetical protein